MDEIYVHTKTGNFYIVRHNGILKIKTPIKHMYNDMNCINYQRLYHPKFPEADITTMYTRLVADFESSFKKSTVEEYEKWSGMRVTGSL